MRYADPLVSSSHLTVAISQSGETADTLAAASGASDYSVGEEDFVKEVTGHQSPVTSQSEEGADDEADPADSPAGEDSEPETGDRRPETDSDESGEAAEEESQ